MAKDFYSGHMGYLVRTMIHKKWRGSWQDKNHSGSGRAKGGRPAVDGTLRGDAGYGTASGGTAC